MPAPVIESPLTRSRNPRPARERLGHGQIIVDVLLGEKRRARCDLPEERKLVLLSALARDQLERTRLGRIALEQSARSRLARWACTVEGEASPTACPISRTVGG